MNKVPFGKTGLRVSPLGFGAAPIGYLKTDQERAATILNVLLDQGVNLIDTAASYKGAEEVIGSAVGHRRDEYVLVSKCGSEVPQAAGKAWSAELVRNTVDASLKRLRTDRLDVMLLHSCDLKTLQDGEALGALVKAREAGKIRFAGYSGDNETVAWAAAQPDIAVIETSVNLVDQNNVDVVLPVTRENNVGVLAKRPIANSAWRGPEAFSGIYPDYVRPYWERFQKFPLKPQDLGFTGEQDWAEIALRFTLSLPGVHTAIIGTTNPDNARANIATANRGPLPADAVKKIRDAFHKAAAGTWPGLT
jgi:aryl-alcohol dehydrogenase-like predicted oxidoreductase